jgi:uncharacterized membrane protein YphA (DoxX/SURF4 family)
MKPNKKRVRTWQFIGLAALVVFIIFVRHTNENYRMLVQNPPQGKIQAMHNEEHVLIGILLIYILFLGGSLLLDFKGRDKISN